MNDTDRVTEALRRLAGRLDGLSEARRVERSYVRPLLRPTRQRRPAFAAAAAVLALVAGTVVALAAARGDRAPTAGQATVGERILLLADGWSVSRYDEQETRTGIDSETTFTRDDGVSVDLHQRSGDYNTEFMSGPSNVTVLGESGVILDTEDHRTFWRHGEWDLELRGGLPAVTEPSEWLGLVASLHYVDDATWRAALPASAVLPDQRAGIVSEMLAGVPLPAGFDTEALLTAGARVSDRYQLGAQVTGPIVCGWLRQWAVAVTAGDQARRDEALAALRSTHNWAVLEEMSAEGDWPRVIWVSVDALGEAAAAAAGERTPADDLAAGLGCT